MMRILKTFLAEALFFGRIDRTEDVKSGQVSFFTHVCDCIGEFCGSISILFGGLAAYGVAKNAELGILLVAGGATVIFFAIWFFLSPGLNQARTKSTP